MIRASMTSHTGRDDPGGDLGGQLAGDLVGVVAQGEHGSPALSYGWPLATCRRAVSLCVSTKATKSSTPYVARAVSRTCHTDHGGDLYRVAVRVVDLDCRRLLVTDPHRHPAAHGEGVHPAQARATDRPPVTTEELYDPHLSGGNGAQASVTERRPG